MEFWQILVLLFMILVFYLYNKELNQSHEINVIETLQKEKSKKTIAISQYMDKAKSNNGSFSKFIKKVLPFLF